MPSAPRRNSNPGVPEPLPTMSVAGGSVALGGGRKPRRKTFRNAEPELDPWGGPANAMMANDPSNLGIGVGIMGGMTAKELATEKIPTTRPTAVAPGKREREAAAASEAEAAPYAHPNFDLSNIGGDYEEEPLKPLPPPKEPTVHEKLVRGYKANKTTYGDNEKALHKTEEAAANAGPTAVDKEIILAGEGLSEDEAEAARREVYNPEIAARLATIIRDQHGIDLTGKSRTTVYDTALKLGLVKHEGGTYFPGKRIWDSPTQMTDASTVRSFIAKNESSLLHPSQTDMNPKWAANRPTGNYFARKVVDPRAYILHADDPYTAEKREIGSYYSEAKSQARSDVKAKKDPEQLAVEQAKAAANSQAWRDAHNPVVETAPVVEPAPAPAAPATKKPRPTLATKQPAPAKQPAAKKATPAKKNPPKKK